MAHHPPGRGRDRQQARDTAVRPGRRAGARRTRPRPGRRPVPAATASERSAGGAASSAPAGRRLHPAAIDDVGEAETDGHRQRDRGEPTARPQPGVERAHARLGPGEERTAETGGPQPPRGLAGRSPQHRLPGPRRKAPRDGEPDGSRRAVHHDRPPPGAGRRTSRRFAAEPAHDLEQVLGAHRQQVVQPRREPGDDALVDRAAPGQGRRERAGRRRRGDEQPDAGRRVRRHRTDDVGVAVRRPPGHWRARLMGSCCRLIRAPWFTLGVGGPRPRQLPSVGASSSGGRHDDGTGNEPPSRRGRSRPAPVGGDAHTAPDHGARAARRAPDPQAPEVAAALHLERHRRRAAAGLQLLHAFVAAPRLVDPGPDRGDHRGDRLRARGHRGVVRAVPHRPTPLPRRAPSRLAGARRRSGQCSGS